MIYDSDHLHRIDPAQHGTTKTACMNFVHNAEASVMGARMADLRPVKFSQHRSIIISRPSLGRAHLERLLYDLYDHPSVTANVNLLAKCTLGKTRMGH